MGLVGYTQLSIGIELEKKYSHRTQNPNELKRALYYQCLIQKADGREFYFTS